MMSDYIRTSHWDDVYQQLEVEEMPWFSPRLDRDIDKALAELQIVKGAIIDIGTGPGTQAIALARLGFKTTGIDVSETAIRKARIRAAEDETRVTFLNENILDTKHDGRYNIAIDRGCFHIIAPADRPRYVRRVFKLLKPRGYLFLKCFSHKEPPGPGPYRLAPDEIKSQFEARFKVLSIRETNFKGTLPQAPKALFCILQRKGLK